MKGLHFPRFCLVGNDVEDICETLNVSVKRLGKENWRIRRKNMLKGERALPSTVSTNAKCLLQDGFSHER